MQPSPLTGSPLLRLLQLSSAALPVGAYAYSHGLEYAAHAGWVSDEATARDWICGLLEHSLGSLDVPVLKRICEAWGAGDEPVARRWMAFANACRESSELAAEEQRLGAALVRVLVNLGLVRAQAFTADERATYLGLFGLAAVEFGIELEPAASALAFAWTENQVACATRVLPLGQLAAQRILSSAIELVPRIVRNGLGLADDEIGASAPGLGLASALHENQYSRLFRS